MATSQHGVRPKEQVAQSATAQVGQPAAAQMFGPVVQQVASLAPCREIAVGVQAGVVRPMAGRQDRQGQPRRAQIGAVAHRLAASRAPETVSRVEDSRQQLPHRPAAIIAPQAVLRIVPCASIDAGDDAAVRTAARLAAARCTAEADRGRKLRPVDRVEVAVFGADRHGPATLARQQA